MINRQKYAPPKVIGIDVDGTLQKNGLPNTRLIEWCRERKSEGFALMLWSARGEAYARNYAERFDVLELFDLICSKPGYIVDDQGWGWIKYMRVIRSLSAPVDAETDEQCAEPPN
jgi:hydroxymethylpyrimidine pyrophosphatase-like HAD family hydrolase